jgi:hypothetical protein
MKLLIWSLVLTMILFFGFATIISPTSITRSLPVHKILYIDRNIDDEELYHIVRASFEWFDATSGQVIFDIRRLPSQEINSHNAIFIFNVSPDYPQVIFLDAVNSQTTLGFFNNDNLASIGLVDQRIEEGLLTRVIEHELFHSLGMKHQEGIEGIGTLMFPNIELGASHITRTDLMHFCELYHCDYTKFSLHELD